MKTAIYTDLGQHIASRLALSRVRSDVARLTQEMSSGLHSDPARNLQGDTRILSGLTQMVAVNSAAQIQVAQVQLRLGSQSEILESVSADIDGVANLLLRPEMIATDDRLAPTARQILQTFENVTSLLNTQIAGRSLFAGTAVDKPALNTTQDILTALAAQIPPRAQASEVVEITNAWFAPGGGFDAFLPRPSEPEGRTDLGSGVFVTSGPQAGSAPLRKALAALAKGSVLAHRQQDLSAETQRQILAGLSDELRGVAGGVRLQTEMIGADLARSESVLTRLNAQKDFAQAALNDITLVDPYETASVLQDKIARLDQILAVTARLSRLSLSNYL